MLKVLRYYERSYLGIEKFCKFTFYKISLFFIRVRLRRVILKIGKSFEKVIVGVYVKFFYGGW